MGDVDGVGNTVKRSIRLRLNAQIVVARSDVGGERQRLFFIAAIGSGWFAGHLEGVQVFPAVHVLADGPGDFLVELLAGEDARRMDEVRDSGVFADANLPRKFTEDEIGIGIASLKMFVGFSEVIGGGTGAIEEGAVHAGQRLANTDVVPISVLFAEVANGLVRIEENVLVPIVSDSVNGGAAPLKPDDFVIRAAKLAARAKGNERLDFTGGGFELLKNCQVGIFGVQDGMAAPAYHRFSLPARTQHDR